MLDWAKNLLRHGLSGERSAQATARPDLVRATMSQRARDLAAGRGSDLLPIGELADDRLPVLLTAAETRRHALILGATGTGKSVFLTNLVAQLLRRRHHESVVVLDPHGALDAAALRLAAASGAPTVHLNLSGHGVVTPWNPLGAMTGLTVDERAASAHRAFSSAFAPTAGGGFVDATLRTVLYLLACAPDEYSLADAELLLLEPGRAERVLARVPSPNPSAVSYVRQLRALGPRASYTQTRYAFSRLDSLLAAPGSRATFCGRGTFDLAAFLRRPGVLVVSAPRAVLAEAAVPTLAWLLELVVHALMRRQLPCRDPHVTIVVDEVLSIGEKIPALTAVLAELRKFRVALCGSFQNLTQCSDRRLVDEFVSNTGLKVLFALSPADAGRFCDLLALPSPRRPRFDVGRGYVISGHQAAFEEPGRDRDRAEVASFERALRDCPARSFHLGLTLGEKPATTRVRAPRPVEIPDVSPRLLHARSLADVQRELAQRAARLAGRRDTEFADRAPVRRGQVRRQDLRRGPDGGEHGAPGHGGLTNI